MGCGASSAKAKYIEPRGDGKSGLYWVPTPEIHKLARSAGPASIESKMLVNQMAIFKALLVEGKTLPYPPDAEAMELALQSGKQGQLESQLLVNQELLFKQLCGAEVQGLPHAPVGSGGAKKYIEGLKSPGRAKQNRRVDISNIESKMALNQHAFHSKMNGRAIRELPCQPGEDEVKLAGFNGYKDDETFVETIKCKLLMNQMAFLSKMTDGDTSRAGVPLWKWKKMSLRRRMLRRMSGDTSKMVRSISDLAAEEVGVITNSGELTAMKRSRSASFTAAANSELAACGQESTSSPVRKASLLNVEKVSLVVDCSLDAKQGVSDNSSNGRDPSPVSRLIAELEQATRLTKAEQLLKTPIRSHRTSAKVEALIVEAELAAIDMAATSGKDVTRKEGLDGWVGSC